MTYRDYGPDPAELAFFLALAALGLGLYALYWVGFVVKARRRQKQAEWLLRERLARWRWRAEHAAPEPVASPARPAPEPPAG